MYNSVHEPVCASNTGKQCSPDRRSIGERGRHDGRKKMRGKRKKLVLGSKRSLEEGGAGRVWVRMEREVAGNEKEKEKAESEGRIPERPSRSGYANWGPFVPHVSTYKRTYAVTRTLLSYLCA